MEFGAVVGLIAAVILFLYGIEHLSRELQRIASERLRGALQRVAGNRWSGALAGAATTAAIQSSTATTVIVVGLVNAGILSFTQSLGVIAGANVGTTITAQLIAFKLTTLAPILIVFGFLVSIFGSRFKFLGKTIFYFGFLFLAINFLSEAVVPFKENPAVTGFMGSMENPLFAIIAGALLSTLFQSSSATTGIVVVLGAEGMLGLGPAIAIIMGANIGTTTTTLFSAWKMDLFAKRSAVAHAIFNICGVLAFVPILLPFAGFVEGFGGNPGQMVANAHTIFNITTAIAFLLLLEPIAKLVARAVPGREREILFKTKYLEDLPKSEDAIIRAVEREIIRQMKLVRESFYLSYGMVRRGESGRMGKVAKLEALNNYLEERISEVLLDVSERELTEEQSEIVITLVRISNEMERMGDLSESFAKLAVSMDERGEKLHPDAVEELDKVKKGFDFIMERVISEGKGMNKRTFRSITQKRAHTDRIIQREYRSHIKRLAQDEISALTNTIFIDAIYSIEQANSALLRLGRLLIKLKKENKALEG
jgi:phosphate:Na+ symporter